VLFSLPQNSDYSRGAGLTTIAVLNTAAPAVIELCAALKESTPPTATGTAVIRTAATAILSARNRPQESALLAAAFVACVVAGAIEKVPTVGVCRGGGQSMT
jgi:hypothetical protein